MTYLGDFAEDSTIVRRFTTNDGLGGAVAPSSAFEAADIIIYKDNSATQKTSTNGVTMTSPFDAITGLHMIEIDTSNDTGDAGFWTIGSDYEVVLSPDETVDDQTVVKVLFQFSIENRTTFPKADYPANFASMAIEADGQVHGDLKEWLGVAPLALASQRPQVEVDAYDGSLDFNATQKASVNTEADTALTDYNAPTYDELLAFVQLLARSDAAINTDRSTELAAINTNEGSGAGDFDNTSDAEEAIADAVAGIGISGAAIADAVWDEAQGDHVAVGSFGEIATEIASILGHTGTSGVQVADKTGYALTSAERDSIAAALLDLANAIETGMTMRGALRVALAALAGKAAGLNTTTATYQNAQVGSKDRITATVDQYGNRTAVTLDQS